jgi:hypothetical protein
LSALKGLLRERRTPCSEIASVLGMPIGKFSNRVNGHGFFKASELFLIAKYFKLRANEFKAVLFENV